MPWGNSWSGSGQVIASQVEVVNGSGAVVAAINPDGSATFTEISDSGDFFYQGTELTDLLQQFALGIQASGVFLLPSGTITGSTPVVLGGCTWQSLDGRAYRFTMTDITYTCSPNGQGHGAVLSLINDSTNLGNFDEYAGNVNDGLGHSFFSWSNTNTLGTGSHTLSVEIAPQVSTDTLTMISHHATVVVEDLGPLVVDTGFTGVIPPNPATKHSFQMNALHTASYQGGGAQSDGSGADEGTYMYFGEDPGYSPNGNWRSYAWFNNSNLTNMAGFSSCSQFDVYCDIPWWYQDAGGTLYIGYHNDNSGSPPGTQPGSHAYQLVSSGFSARGQAKWVSLLGNATIMAAVKAGTFKGIIFGPGPTTSFSFYGYGYGSDSGCPKLRATYIK